MARVAYLATVITYCWISATPCCSADDGEASESLQIQAAHRVQQSAVGIDFAAELQLEFPSLTSLGVRIEQARRHRDPVGLAFAARELAVMERVAERSARITADELQNESIDAARYRNRPQELRAIAEIMPARRELFLALATKAEQYRQQSQDDAQASSGVSRKGIRRNLTVVNQTDLLLYVFYNDLRLGWVEAAETTDFPVNDSSGQSRVKLTAENRHTGDVWEFRGQGQAENYLWNVTLAEQ